MVSEGMETPAQGSSAPLIDPIKRCDKICHNGKPCQRDYRHNGKHVSAYCPTCGVNPAKFGKRIHQCTECTTDYYRGKKYGISLEGIQALKDKQEGLCVWCGLVLGRKFAVDHSHHTKQVRCLVHIHCNTEIGRIEAWLALSEEERQRRMQVFR